MKENFVTSYFKNAFQEFHKISWPTQDTAIKLTLIVLMVCISTMVIIGVLDSLLQQLFERLITK